jgi:hypothetical protein
VNRCSAVWLSEAVAAHESLTHASNASRRVTKPACTSSNCNHRTQSCTKICHQSVTLRICNCRGHDNCNGVCVPQECTVQVVLLHTAALRTFLAFRSFCYVRHALMQRLWRQYVACGKKAKNGHGLICHAWTLCDAHRGMLRRFQFIPLT